MIDLRNLIEQVAPGAAVRVRRHKVHWTRPDERGVQPRILGETDMWDVDEAGEAAMQEALDWCVDWVEGATPPTAAELLAAIPDLRKAEAKRAEAAAAARGRQERIGRLDPVRVLKDLVAAGAIDKTALNAEDADALAALAESEPSP